MNFSFILKKKKIVYFFVFLLSTTLSFFSSSVFAAPAQVITIDGTASTSNNILAPGSSITTVDSFLLRTSTSTARAQTITVDLNGGSSNAGTLWTERTSASSGLWSGVTYGNGLFVAVSATSSAQSLTLFESNPL
mgnify:FL=1